MIPLAVPNLVGNEKKYLEDCIDTTFVSSIGEYVNRFEKMIAKETGSKYAVATSSGTTGLHTALVTVGVKRDELVIIPTFTFIASANAVSHCGAIPWIMDISPSDWCLDPDIVRRNIEINCEQCDSGLIHKKYGKRIAAIMPVYTLGNIPDMDKFRAIANDYCVPLVADAACAIGATYNGEMIGGLADLSVLSFNGNKTITCGGGGAVVGNDEVLLNRVRHLTTTARVWPDYDFDEVGFNYRMTNIQAAVGCAQLERLEEFIRMKCYIREYYKEHMSGLTDKGYSFFSTTDGSSCWLSGIVFPEGTVIDEIKKTCACLDNKGIESRPFWKPIHLQKPYRNSPVGNVEIAESLWQRLMSLPCSTGISNNELNNVANAICNII